MKNKFNINKEIILLKNELYEELYLIRDDEILNIYRDDYIGKLEFKDKKELEKYKNNIIIKYILDIDKKRREYVVLKPEEKQEIYEKLRSLIG